MSTPTGTSPLRRSSCIVKGAAYIANAFNKIPINRQFLLLLPDMTDDQPNPQPLPPLPGTTRNLNIIIADLPDLHPFAGDTVDWLIRVARLIFQPLSTSSLYTFTMESVEWWLGREMQLPLWRVVLPGEQLRATIYEFCLNNNALIKLTTNTSACIITHHTMERVLISSHLIPRWLGNLGVRSIIQCFTGLATIGDRYDPAIGVSLFMGLDTLVDSFELGFWNNGPDQHVVHSFADMPLDIWVLKKFSTPAYQQINNIAYFSLPFHTRDDDEDESDVDFDDDRNIANPPYPSYLWELSEMRAYQHLEAVERNRMPHL
ncbi:hypothetical protein L208DRAFT_1469460 [Tricholoma matsutake]|nr:hypothetical protein L208DRAFT_1469460 [Tricholoma matsutake 945]